MREFFQLLSDFPVTSVFLAIVMLVGLNETYMFIISLVEAFKSNNYDEE